MVVPTTAFPELSPRLEPVPSLRFQPPIRLVVGPVISRFLAAWICACERAVFQMRTSSIVPAKKPSGLLPAVPSELPMAVMTVGGDVRVPG